MALKMDQARLAQVQDTIRADIAAGLYHGAVIQVARGGEVQLAAAIGAADGEGTKPLAIDSVFNIFSVTRHSPTCWCCARWSRGVSSSPRRSPR